MNIRPLIIFSLLVLLISCETSEKIDDFPLRPSQMVVNCFFYPDSIWEFQVSKSLSVLDNADLKLLEDATVKIFEDSKLILSIDSMDEDKWYRSNSKLPKIGKEYSVEVSSPKFKNKLYAKDRTPPLIPILDAEIFIRDSFFYESSFDSYGNINGNFDILFDDPPETNNYYQLKIFSFDSVYSYYDEGTAKLKIEKRQIHISSDDPSIENSSDYSDNLIFSDYLFNGQKFKLSVNFENWNANRWSSYIIELLSFTKEGYLYRKTVDNFGNSISDPFSEAVQVYSNIENGFGIFAGYTSNTFEVNPWK